MKALYWTLGVSFGIAAAGCAAYTFPHYLRMEMGHDTDDQEVTIGYLNPLFPVLVVHHSGKMTTEERQQYLDEVGTIIKKIYDERNWFWKWVYPDSRKQ